MKKNSDATTLSFINKLAHIINPIRMYVSFLGGAWRLAVFGLPVFLVLMAFGASLQAQSEKKVVDKVVAIVGGEIVQLSDVMEQTHTPASSNPIFRRITIAMRCKISSCKKCWCTALSWTP